jgi:high-affinity nickel permease
VTTDARGPRRAGRQVAIGTIELLQVGIGGLALKGGFWQFIGSLDFNRLGYATAALFLVAWVGAAIAWKIACREEHWSNSLD